MRDGETAFAALRAAMLSAYSGTLASTSMTPLQALEALAATLGSTYREVADAHVDPRGCQCGWQPDARSDILALRQAIAANAERDTQPDFDLRSIIPADHG